MSQKAKHCETCGLELTPEELSSLLPHECPPGFLEEGATVKLTEPIGDDE